MEGCVISESLTAPLQGMPQSATLAINQRSIELQEAGRGVDALCGWLRG
jgi:hypothetical protein